jgi:tetratricopeptide (TPR) repeat protein
MLRRPSYPSPAIIEMLLHEQPLRGYHSMIRICLCGALILSFVLGKASAQNVLRIADSLVLAKQYNSAFKFLNDVPGSDENSDIVLKKVDIALKWFVESIMHQMFAFKDLSQDETVEDYRGEEGKYDMYAFAVDTVLTRLILKNPHDGRLHRSLADFYFDVFWKYGDKWLVPKDSIILFMQRHYVTATENGICDYRLYHNLGVAYLQLKKSRNAIISFKKSLDLNPNFASSNYNLAYAFLDIDSMQSASKYAQIALGLYEDPDLKADAAHLAGLSYLGMKSYPSAISFLVLADSLKPNNYYFHLNLLQAYLGGRQSTQADKTATSLFEMGPKNPRICSDIVKAYSKSSLKSSLPPLLSGFAESHFRDPEVVGNVYFHLSSYYEQEKDSSAAIVNLGKARSTFHKCFPDTHYVFRVIDERTLRLQAK